MGPVAVKAVSSLAVPPARLSTPQMGLPPSVMQKIHEALPLVEKHSDIKVDTECCHLMNSMQAGVHVYVQCMHRTVCALWVPCTLIRRHLNSVQAPPREANEALVYATKQVQSGPGLGLRYMECTTTHAEHHTVYLHRRWGRTTPSRGTLTTAPSTRYAEDQLPQCMYTAPHQGCA